MRLALAAIIGLCAVAASAGAYPLKQVSRYSWFTNKGWYDFHAPGQTPSHTDWNVSDSTHAFGPWDANTSGALYFGGDQKSTADPYRGWISAVAMDDAFSGNQSSWFWHVTNGFEYVFDVVVPLRVKLSGIGMKLTSTNGFSYTINLANGVQVEKALPVGRYTYATTVSSGSVSATSEMRVMSCPCDLTGDNLVDDADFTEFVRTYDILVCTAPGMGWSCLSDFNADGSVDDADFVLFVQSYSALFCP